MGDADGSIHHRADNGDRPSKSRQDRRSDKSAALFLRLQTVRDRPVRQRADVAGGASEKRQLCR